jgi:hypothetical protein
VTVADGAAWDRGWRGVDVREWLLRASSKLDKATRETGAKLGTLWRRLWSQEQMRCRAVLGQVC